MIEYLLYTYPAGFENDMLLLNVYSLTSSTPIHIPTRTKLPSSVLSDIYPVEFP